MIFDGGKIKNIPEHDEMFSGHCFSNCRRLKAIRHKPQTARTFPRSCWVEIWLKRSTKRQDTGISAAYATLILTYSKTTLYLKRLMMTGCLCVTPVVPLYVHDSTNEGHISYKSVVSGCKQGLCFFAGGISFWLNMVFPLVAVPPSAINRSSDHFSSVYLWNPKGVGVLGHFEVSRYTN